MSPWKLTPLRKPCTRRVGKLIVTLEADGVRIRGKYRRKSRLLTWAQVASLASGEEPLIFADETARGTKELKRIGALEC